MKKIRLTLIVCLCYSMGVLAQSITNTILSTNFEYNSLNPNNHSFRFTTNFFEANPQNNSHSIEVIGDTLFVNIYYNVIGFWVFESYNQSIDDVEFNELLPSSVNYIKMSTNALNYGEKPPFEPITIEDIYFRIFDLNNLTIQENETKNIEIFPNPATGSFTINSRTKINTIEIYNLVGKQVMSVTSKNDTERIQLINCPAGVYFVKLTSDNGAVVKKLIIQ